MSEYRTAKLAIVLEGEIIGLPYIEVLAPIEIVAISGNTLKLANGQEIIVDPETAKRVAEVLQEEV